jgi:hypothetical protein
MIFENNGVYINYSDEIFNFHKLSSEEKILLVDLDNQELKSDNILEKMENLQMNDDNLSEEITGKNDLITLNYFPISKSHCYLTICYDLNFPQLLSSEFIIQALQIFSIANNPTLRLGYNSLGAGCIINHLHFEFLFLDDFQGINKLPIELAETYTILKTQLLHLNEEEISMFDENILVTFSSLNYPLRAWKVVATEISHSEDSSTYQNSISNCVNFILSELIENEIPHNLLISESGRSIYIMPRKFASNSCLINYCWNDLSGIITLRNDTISEDTKLDESLLTNCINEISLSEDKFIEMTQQIIQKFENLYKIEK